MTNSGFLEGGVMFFDKVISLGGTCQVAHQLNRLGLRQESMPFDWLFSCFDDDLFIKAIESDFANWLSLDNLYVFEYTNTEHLRVSDTYYNMLHQHIFPLDKDVKETYEEVNSMVQRRVNRFLDMKGKNLDLLFIRTNMSPENAGKLISILKDKYGPNSVLLVINHTETEGLREISSDIPDVFMYEMYDNNLHHDGDWRGDNTLWETVLKNTRLKDSKFNIRVDEYFSDTYPCEVTADKHYFRWGGVNATLNLHKFTGYYIRVTLRVLKPTKVDLLEGDKLIKTFKIYSKKDLCFRIDSDKYTFRANEATSAATFSDGADTREFGVQFFDIDLSCTELKPLIKDDSFLKNAAVSVVKSLRSKK